MRMNDLFAQRPLENGKPAILRGDQCDRVPLILDELRRGKVPGATELFGMDKRGDPPFDGFDSAELVDLGVALAPHNLGAETEYFVLIRQDHRAIHGSQPGNGINGALRLLGVMVAEVG